MIEAYIGIGSNVGNREENIAKAISLLSEHCKIIKFSSLYETEPIGYKEQNWFLNAVVEIETLHQPANFLLVLQNIERNLGRIRKVKNEPRVIDLDLLLYGDQVIRQEDLMVPHPELHTRLFVLIPLVEIAPQLMHPTLKKSISELANSCKTVAKDTVIFLRRLP